LNGVKGKHKNLQVVAAQPISNAISRNWGFAEA